MFPMTVTLSNMTQLNAVMAALALNVEQPAPAEKPAAPKKTQQQAATVKETVTQNGTSTQPVVSSQLPPAEGAAQEPAVESSPSIEASTAASDKPATYDDVKAAIVKLSGAKGRDAVVACLQQFGAAKGPDLKPDQFAAFIAAVEKALA